MSESSGADAPKTRSCRAVAEVRFRVESLPGRNRAARVGFREINPDVSLGVGWDRQLAVADRHHAMRLSESRFAAGVQRLDDIGRAPCATRSASMARLGCKAPFTLRMSGTRRTTLSSSGRQLRKPMPAACCASSGSGMRSPGDGAKNFAASSPAVDKSRLRRTARVIRHIGDEAAQDNGPVVHRSRKGAIGGLVRRSGGVAAVLFREQEVECDRRGSGAFHASTSAPRRSCGHGHCPHRLSNSSSTATMRTGWSNS